jgi:germination protein M
MKKINYGILLLLLFCLLTGCEKKGKSTADYQIFYVSNTGVRLVEESFSAGEGTPKELTEKLLHRMVNPAMGADYQAALPEEVEINRCVLGTNQILLDFSKEYYEMDSIREVLVRAAYVNTLSQVPDVKEIILTVDGQELIDHAGDVVGPLTADSFIDTRGNDGINSYQYASLSLYFADETGTEIVREMRNVHYSSNTTLEKVVVEQLLKGPVNTELVQTVPADAKILNTQIQGEVCTINFDGALNQKPENTNLTAETCVYSIVNAVIDACGVTKVQIQIEGTSEVSLWGEQNLNEPFEKNQEIMKKLSAGEGNLLSPSIGVDAFLTDFF